jgi:hypothetical protein
LQLIGDPAFVLRRDSTYGLVIINPTDIVQRLPLGRAYRFRAGDQPPRANSGRLTHAVTLARYRAAILLSVRSHWPVAGYAGSIAIAGRCE